MMKRLAMWGCVVTMMAGLATAQQTRPPQPTVSGVTRAPSSVPMALPAALPLRHPRVLIVVAHPDDESCFAATVYEITHNLGGTVDQMVITNGEGGFRYSLLAEPIYHLELTNEAVGRAALPEIRKRELLEAGHILGIANHFFLDQRDLRYTLDIDEVLTQHWNQPDVRQAVAQRLASGNYDFVFTLFPSPETHGGHKAATLTALEAARAVSQARPVVLGCQIAQSNEKLSWQPFVSARHPVVVLPSTYRTDRRVKFGFRNALDYRVIVNWVIAAHKSQGAYQLGMNQGDDEEFAILDDGASDEATRTRTLFDALAKNAAHPGATPTH